GRAGRRPPAARRAADAGPRRDDAQRPPGDGRPPCGDGAGPGLRRGAAARAGQDPARARRGGQRGPAVAHRPAGGRPPARRPGGGRGLRVPRRHVGLLLPGLRPRLDRPAGHGPGLRRPLRRGLRQRLLERRADGLRRRQRRHLHAPDAVPGRLRARADPRGHPVRRAARLPAPVRRAQRERGGLLRRDDRPVPPRGDRRGGRLAHRARAARPGRDGPGAAQPRRARHGVRRRRARHGSPARAHGRLRRHDGGQRRRPRELGDPEQGLPQPGHAARRPVVGGRGADPLHDPRPPAPAPDVELPRVRPGERRRRADPLRGGEPRGLRRRGGVGGRRRGAL
ncbi:MAG: putative metalloprotease, partial [uncultured Solirubrobacteraceae bacterium]